MNSSNYNELERVYNYSIELVEEISREIETLNNYVGHSGNNLGKIKKKIDLARLNGVNVYALDLQVKEFRIKLFKRQIKHKIEQLENEWSNYALDISKIEEEYQDLKKEINIDHDLLAQLMNHLYDEVVRAKIKHKIHSIIESRGNSIYSIDMVDDEIKSAEENKIYVSDIKKMIFGE